MSLEPDGGRVLESQGPSRGTYQARERIYRLWERGHWLASSIDFRQDTIDWHTALSEEQRRAISYIISMMLFGEQFVTADLSSFITAASWHEDRILLSA